MLSMMAFVLFEKLRDYLSHPKYKKAQRSEFETEVHQDRRRGYA